MAELGEIAAERERDPALEKVGDAEQPFGRGERKDVGLLEIAVRRVNNEGDAVGHLMTELEAKNLVALLRVLQRGRRQLGFFGIEVQVDVRALQNLPFELAILDLVLTENGKLRVPGCGGHREKNKGEQEQPANHLLIERIRSPWVIRLSTGKPSTTCPNTV